LEQEHISGLRRAMSAAIHTARLRFSGFAMSTAVPWAAMACSIRSATAITTAIALRP